MSREQNDLTLRERLTLRLLFIALRVVVGRSFDGGIGSHVEEAVAQVEGEIFLREVKIRPRSDIVKSTEKRIDP